MARRPLVQRIRKRVGSARRRRPPEQARTELLDAAERVFAAAQPDQVGLKDVAREAGVSHALITHYFGTYAGLVEATLERRVRALRATMLERLKEAGALSRPAELLATLFRTLEDPVHLRLTTWLMASARPAATHAFALRDHGLQQVAQLVASALAAGPPAAALVERVELALVCAVAAAYGYAIGKHALAGALGREPSPELDRAVYEALAEMMRARLVRA